MSRRLSSCLFLTSLALMPAVLCLGQPGPSLRAVLPLETWRFQPGRADAEPAEADWVSIPLPYLWTQTWTRPAVADATSWAKQDLRGANSAWYEADVSVPADWQNQSIVLDLSGVQCDAIAFVDGRRVGEVEGPDGRVELTGVAQPGKTARVRLWVTRWWERTENQRSRDLFRDLTIQSMSRSEWFHNEDEARCAIPGGLGGVSLLALPPMAEVEHVAVATSVRRQELSATLDTRFLAPASGARFRVQVSEIGGSAEGLPAATVPVQNPAEQTHSQSQTVTLPWPNPHLWDVGAPYLYRLHVTVLGPGNEKLDEYPPVRFGFREIWAEGRELILNGHPLHLRPGYFTQSVPQMLMFEGMGFNTIVFQPNPTGWYGPWGLFPGAGLQGGTEALLDAADERGWAVLMPAPGVSIIRDALLKPEAQPLYLHDLRAWLREWDRGNRPSMDSLHEHAGGVRPRGRRPQADLAPAGLVRRGREADPVR
jgi:beta-galactosidase